jgi:hypothetical protein
MSRWPDETPVQRFWRHVIKTRKCWFWDLSKNGDYGAIKIAGVQKKAHRFCWELHFGAIPKGLEVCHTCDNPSCVRPSHLFLGTHLDNMSDCARKGRTNGAAKSQPGEQNARAKLTWEIVDYIRASKEGMMALSRRFGVHYAHICSIKSGNRWPPEKHP